MSSYLSSILTNTTSRYNSIRRTLLSDETDGDTEDDSHISRVLRAYYTEKGRPFPPWLPPDPKAPQAAPAQFVSAANRQPQRSSAGRGGGLSDLWDSSPQSGQPLKESLSLRRGAQGRAAAQTAQGRFGGGIVDTYDGGSASPQPAPAQRLLPSQRAGSYQSAASQQREPVARSGSSAQERLKARLLSGNKSTSPLQSPLPSPGLPPTSSQRNPYDRSASYEDQAPARSDGRGGGRAEAQKPYVSSSSPWSSEENDPRGGGGYGGGYASGDRGGGYADQGASRGGQGQRNRYGLPSGPKMR